jgi:hypothetical protein
VTLLIADAVARFGAAVTEKRSSTVSGEPEEQLRGPLEGLIADVAEILQFKAGDVTSIGESAVADLSVRPDYAVTVRNLLVGFIELKAPGKGADPSRFRDRHDKEQWEKLSSLPNVLYTDGNEFGLYRDGESVRPIVRLKGDVECDGDAVKAPAEFIGLFQAFLGWEPTPPRGARELAEVSARLCRLLRDEVTEQLREGSESLNVLAADWRELLFPEADDERFADGYAQTVTFGLLAARARDIPLDRGMHHVGKSLAKSNSLIGTALRVVTEDVESDAALKTSFETLRRVLSVVDWDRIVDAAHRRGKSTDETIEPWLYFYEDFLSVYDNDLGKSTGSYYTPPEVVSTMVRLTDEVLRKPDRFGLHRGLGDGSVTVADPAVGTGTFLLGVLRRIAQTAADEEGPGSIGPHIATAIDRLIGFELQLGPFAVAQLRILAEMRELTGSEEPPELRLFVTNTLSDPYTEEERLHGFYAKIGESRRQANRIKKEQPITVVIGNPPYKDKAGGKGSWIEKGTPPQKKGIMRDWDPPKEWGVGAHTKHLKNLYIYFWRWAVWKAFEHPPESDEGIVCFITPAQFLSGPGFDRMRADLRARCSEIWVIECSPEGHRPDVPTRIFEGVQHPVAITLAIRCGDVDKDSPAPVFHRALPEGSRKNKFDALPGISIDDDGWQECATEWRAAFLPAAAGVWSTCVPVLELFVNDYSGTMPGRIWPIAPDSKTLDDRWKALMDADGDQQQELFKPHLRRGDLGDRHTLKALKDGLAGFKKRPAISDELPNAAPEEPIRYSFRTLDRQWIIPDKRLLNQPNPTLWEGRSDSQVYLTLPTDRSPTGGPSVSFCANVPDLHHYNGKGGRVIPLWQDTAAETSNVKTAFVQVLE